LVNVPVKKKKKNLVNIAHSVTRSLRIMRNEGGSYITRFELPSYF